MAGLACSLRVTTPSWSVHSVAAVSPATRNIAIRGGDFDPGGSHHVKQRQLWEDLFANPSEWWDNRLDKRSPRHPDFRHKITRVALWLDNRYKPAWVDSRLGSLGALLQGRVREVSCAESSSPCNELQSLCKEGQLDMALDVLLRMEQQGGVPSVTMYSTILKACASKKALAVAKQVHAHLTTHSPDFTRFLGELVVSTLVKCGGLEDALEEFYRLPHSTVFSWTAVIDGYTRAGQAQEALRMYKSMQEEGVEPNTYTLVSLLKACGSMVDLEEGKRIHLETLKYGCELNSFVGSCLVDMYGKCGSIVDAKNVFDRLSQRDVVSWTAMLAVYVQQCQGDKALELYGHMQEEGVSPDVRTFVIAIQACGMLAEKEQAVAVEGQSAKFESMEQGRRIHADIRKKGYDSDLFVTSSLISMYRKCGSIEVARDVFNGLSQPDVVSWNTMLTAYVEDGRAEEALQLYDQMQKEDVSRNDRTFVSALQACGMLAEKEEAVFVDGRATKSHSLEKGKTIHATARQKGFSSNVFVANTLVSMYGKCGSTRNAQDVFDELFQPDLVSWNAMLAAYAQQGQEEKALQLYEKLLEEGGIPDARTFVCAVHACSLLAEREGHAVEDRQHTTMKSLQMGRTVHAEAWRRDYQSDSFVGISLITMYGKCGRIVDAIGVFDGLSFHNVVAWTAMLAAYIEEEQGEQAWQLYERMLEDGMSPNERTFVNALQASCILAWKEENVMLDGRLTKTKSLERGKAVHAAALMKGYDSDVFVAGALVHLYVKCGSLWHAQNVFDGLAHRDVVVWNTIVAANVEQERGEEALKLYEQMLEAGASPDNWTFVSIIQACSILAKKEVLDFNLHGQSVKIQALELGKVVHARAQRKGYDTDVVVGSTLVTMYGKCGCIVDAWTVFLGLAQRDVVSWNEMVAAYVEQGQGDKALHLYSQMQQQGASQNEITLVCVLQACSQTGSLAKTKQIHNTFDSSGNDLSPFVASSLITAYGRCASMVDAETVFDALRQPDVVSWNALIAGYTRQGDSVASLRCYENMQLAGVRPNGVTFLSLLSLCSHAGLVSKGVEYFESMSKHYSITPEIEHYVCMVDLLGRAGCFTMIEDLLSSMPMQPSLSLWLCLLGACQKYGKVVLGKHAFDGAVRLKPSHGATYVLMSNIYADAGLWDSVKEMNELKQKADAWKRIPGQTWMENGQDVHTFQVGDRSQSQHEQLYDLIRKVSLVLSRGKHIRQTNGIFCDLVSEQSSSRKDSRVANLPNQSVPFQARNYTHCQPRF